MKVLVRVILHSEIFKKHKKKHCEKNVAFAVFPFFSGLHTTKTQKKTLRNIKNMKKIEMKMQILFLLHTVVLRFARISRFFRVIFIFSNFLDWTKHYQNNHINQIKSYQNNCNILFHFIHILNSTFDLNYNIQ